MKCLSALAATLVTASVLLAQDRPLPPEAAAKAMTLPPGFRATLFAGEPDVVQPIAFTFDHRGRMWVVECLSYPKWTNDKSGRDRVTIFEDENGDGKFDKRTVFYDKGSNLSGIEVGFGGVWLCSTPDLIFIPDRDGDDKPDGPPQVLLDGWDLTAKHNVFNGLTWGPDGWLYGCNGILSNSRVGKPGTPDAKRVAMNCGVWRYHPTKLTFEVVAHGTTNPWGLDFDQDGECFITNCVIEHVWHVVPGGHYQRMFGQDLTPNRYALMPSIADHLHWGGGHWTSSRGGKGVHDTPGGGHAHSGCMVYLGDNWPDEYRNDLFTCNIHGSRINRDRLTPKGSTYVASHLPDVIHANDPWFRGLAIKYGPDGGVYVSDWNDTGECHNYDKVDLSNGRIFKIVHGTPKPWKGDLSKLSDVELVKLQTHKNDWFCRMARRLLQERATAGRIDPKAIGQMREMSAVGNPTSSRLRALWSLHSVSANDWWLRTDPSRSFHRWVIRLQADDGNPQSIKETIDWVGFGRLHPSIAMACASAIRRVPVRGNSNLVTSLIAKCQFETNDPLELMLWYALEPTLRRNQIVPMLGKSAQLQQFAVRRLIELDPEYLKRTMSSLALSIPDAEAGLGSIRGVRIALEGRRSVPMPEDWPAVMRWIASTNSDELKEAGLELAVLFDEPGALLNVRRMATDKALPRERRALALRLLRQKNPPDLLDILRPLLDDKILRGEAIRGLAAFSDPAIPELLLKSYAVSTDAEKADIVQTLATRPASALALLDAMADGRVAKRDVSPLIARQMLALKDKDVSRQLDKVWGVIRPVGKERDSLMAKVRAQIPMESLAKADHQKGKLLFGKSCATCHKLFGEGQTIGPDLTGSQRTNLDYLLENVVDPNAIVPREYSITLVEMKDGRTLSGVVVQDTKQALTLQTANERMVLPRGDVEALTPTNTSIMPEGLFDKLTPEELRDLIGYLMRK